jgi:hypothetical protein
MSVNTAGGFESLQDRIILVSNYHAINKTTNEKGDGLDCNMVLFLGGGLTGMYIWHSLGFQYSMGHC